MKTIFTLLLSTIFSLASMAYDGTRLTVTSVSNNKMFVEVDGRRYNLDGNTISISSIRPGTHNIRVLRELKRRAGWNLGNGNRREETLYNIKVTFRNGYHFDILVNRFGKVLIDERRMDPNDDWYDEDDTYDGNDNRDREWDNTNNNGGNRNDKDYGNNDRDTRDNRDYSDDRNNDDPRYDNNYSRAMSIPDFAQAKESLRREWFENTRLASAKQIIDQNYFTSQQVKELMLLFTFENNRLDIAKYAYGKTVDKGNYVVVNDAFTFNSKEKLNEYIREYEEKY
ncbi:MAG TPA: DUF4476 domain-containing protein [Chitinophagaceae bacterium]|nr:DUF4476 domain-containing protein [Chitinophagaceae bacterium]